MTDDGPAAVVDRRIDTLRVLADGPASTPTLVDRVDVSRSTVDRAIHELGALGFVASAPGDNRITTLGRVALAAHDRRSRRLDTLADAAPLFDDVALDVDPAVFDDATLVLAGPRAPHRPVDRVATLVADATHVSVYTARFLGRHARLYHDRVVDAGMTGSFVATDRVIEQVAAARPDDLRDVIDLGRVALRRTGRDDPVTLVLAETPTGPEMGLVVYRDGVPRGFLDNDHPAATRWARAVHERLWTAAAPVDL
ncbi:helix-turn-helix transcriptional regulator [Haloplanus salilacus]|uniref:helix-turn-helix transcriptional regulator n=1 Tax=Haloplanus salilacus TaxID=2949994 RepID=UPI0030CEFD48